jgi:23S rRNA U2552 (ribose-2'-O)-methylase RlmE/FtsJ
MQRCSPFACRKLPLHVYDRSIPFAQATLWVKSSSIFSRCTLSPSSTSSQPGHTSLPSISHTSLSPSPNLLPRHSYKSWRNNLRSKNYIHNHNLRPPSSTQTIGRYEQIRHASSKRWTARQSQDPYTRAAKLSNLKSRAAFKLLQINERYRLFRPGQTIVDLGFAPGSWSQVAIDLVKPSGRVLGVDLIPAQPPKGVSAIQGDFMSEEVQAEVRRFVRDTDRGRLRTPAIMNTISDEGNGQGYVDYERSHTSDNSESEGEILEGREEDDGRCVDVVLSDMSEPWDLVAGHYKRTLSNPYYRMMNTSGNAFRDHVGSMVRHSHCAFVEARADPIAYLFKRFTQYRANRTNLTHTHTPIERYLY